MVGTVILPYRFLGRDSSFSQVETDLKKPHQEAIEVDSGPGVDEDEGRQHDQSSRNLLEQREDGPSNRDIVNLGSPFQLRKSQSLPPPVYNYNRLAGLLPYKLNKRSATIGAKSTKEEISLMHKLSTTSPVKNRSYSSSTSDYSEVTIKETLSIDTVQCFLANNNPLNMVLVYNPSMESHDNNNSNNYDGGTTGHDDCKEAVLALDQDDTIDDDPWNAAKRGDLIALQRFHHDGQNNFDWTQNDKFDSPPLYYACHSGAAIDLRVVIYLLQVWPTPTIPSALMERCRKNAINPNVIRLLDQVSKNRNNRVDDDDDYLMSNHVVLSCSKSEESSDTSQMLGRQLYSRSSEDGDD